MLTVLLLAATAVYAHPEHLVDTAWVAAHSGDAGVRIIDVRRSGFDAGHIPGARWLDPESIRDAGNAPSFLLPPAAFERAIERLGISNRSRVILYDDRGGLLAARLWWALETYGHSNVALLNGGWIQWTAEKRPVSTATTPVATATFKAALQPQWLATVDDVRAAIGKAGTRILDARTVAEMDGTDTRLSSRGGVIPSADLFALHLMGYDHLQNYLGSWEEWSRRTDLPTAPFHK